MAKSRDDELRRLVYCIRRRLLVGALFGAVVGVATAVLINISQGILPEREYLRGAVFGSALVGIAGACVAYILARPIDRLTAKLASFDLEEAHNLLKLAKSGIVRVRGAGQNITSVTAELENRTVRDLSVLIKPGTYFVARGDHQNMVARQQVQCNIDAQSNTRIAIPATCINAARPIPDNSNRFVGVRSVSSQVRRFLEAASGRDSMTVQAGVWALTDAYSADEASSRLLTRDRHGNERPAISEKNLLEARQILEELGIRSNL